jgi:hypothetical protein
MEQKIRILPKTVALICVLPLLCAWVDPVDLNADNTSINDNNALTLTINENDTSFDRCDTENASYTDNALPIPTTCHRWDLVWDAVTTGAVGSEVLTPQTDWVPNILDDEWRLPTIKELTRLINFGVKDSSTLIESPTIKNWFTSDTNWPSDVDINDGVKTVWLISSTYRDIDKNEGDDVAGAIGQAQIFAINIINGEIKTFEPGVKTAMDVTGADFDGGAGLGLCTSLKSDGDCTAYGSIAENIILALKVRTQSVSE